MTTATPAVIKADRPWENNWPKKGLETLGECPVCGSAKRRSLHANLVDNTFFCAPGVWEMWKCTKCCSGYLDPRPTTDTIGMAYQNYYTHSSKISGERSESLNWINKLSRKAINSYTNSRYETTAQPANAFGAYLLSIMPILRRRIDREFRNLKKRKGQQSTLLDIGAGSGDFLLVAQACGWKAIGVDPDPRAIKRAEALRVDVRLGGVELFKHESNRFEYITLSHVIEHLHDPVAVIDACFRLLKPGGTIWIETPSIEALSRNYFGNNWRGLEAPRHLVLFSHSSIFTTLRSAGFVLIKREARPIRSLGIFRESWLLQYGLRPDNNKKKNSYVFKFKKAIMVLLELIFPRRRELITVTASKPTLITK